MMKRIKAFLHKTKEKAEDLEWWEKPDAPKDKIPTQNELIKKIEEMRIAQKGIPRSLVLKQVAAFVFILINGGLLFSSIGQPLGIWVYLYTIPMILILFDYLFTIRTLGKIAGGEKK